MEQKYLVDTNVIIDNFGNKLSTKAKTLLNKIDLNISAITKIEVLGWKMPPNNNCNHYMIL
jgi:predicted nucleic acid-binding protein